MTTIARKPKEKITVTATIARKPKEKITITIGHINIMNINNAIDNGEFSSVSEAIDKGMSFYFDNRNKPSKDGEFQDYLKSPDGQAILNSAIKERVKDIDSAKELDELKQEVGATKKKYAGRVIN
jgi:Arc/MetJ-type ribon-helix-helix transcriptional regulator